MYLEISARQTGKTTRMMQEVQKRSWQGKRSIVITNNHAMARHLRLEWDLGLVEFMTKHESSKVADAYYQQGILEETRWFYDEFDMSGSSNYYFDPEGYYVTTLSFRRDVKDWAIYLMGYSNDMYLKLMDENHGFFVSYSAMPRVLKSKSLQEIKELASGIKDGWYKETEFLV